MGLGYQAEPHLNTSRYVIYLFGGIEQVNVYLKSEFYLHNMVILS